MAKTVANIFSLYIVALSTHIGGVMANALPLNAV
jgi:hypothetical protein